MLKYFWSHDERLLIKIGRDSKKTTYVRTNIFSKLQTHFGSTYYFNKI